MSTNEVCDIEFVRSLVKRGNRNTQARSFDLWLKLNKP